VSQLEPMLLHIWKWHKKVITWKVSAFCSSFPSQYMTVQTRWILLFLAIRLSLINFKTEILNISVNFWDILLKFSLISLILHVVSVKKFPKIQKCVVANCYFTSWFDAEWPNNLCCAIMQPHSYKETIHGRPVFGHIFLSLLNILDNLWIF